MKNSNKKKWRYPTLTKINLAGGRHKYIYEDSLFYKGS